MIKSIAVFHGVLLHRPESRTGHPYVGIRTVSFWQKRFNMGRPTKFFDRADAAVLVTGSNLPKERNIAP
jgi:hypothetical protein